MNIATAKKPLKRIDTPPFQNLGIVGYGKDNLYPQELLNIVSASETAVSCLNRRTNFIEGNGFLDLKFAETILNSKGETADDILKQLAEDVSNFNGFAIHVNYNMLGEPVSFFHVPFENCRLCEPDDSGYIGKIAVHPDWSGKTKRNGKLLKVEKSTIDYINIYNPDPKIVTAQIENAGGIEHYKGQILWVGKGKQTYPIPAHDVVVAYMNTEEGLGNIVNRNVRNGLNPSAVFIRKKGLESIEQTEGAPDNAPVNSSDTLVESLTEARGDENSSNIMVFEVDKEEDMPQFIKMQSNNYDKEFTITTETCERKIYSAFDQDIFYIIKHGSVAFFSTGRVQSAYEYYSSVTGRERRLIERAFDKLFRDAGINPSNDFTIQPLIYESVDSKPADNDEPIHSFTHSLFHS